MLKGAVRFLKQCLDTVVAAVSPRKFVHVVGDHLDWADVTLNGRRIDLNALPGRAKHGGISDYFTLNAGHTTYVFWNNPDSVQRNIHASPARKNHIVLGDMAGGRLALVTDTAGRHARPTFTVAARQEAQSPSFLESCTPEFREAYRNLRETVRERSSTIPGALTPA